MPIVPPATTAPYQTLEYALKLARAYVNDMGISADGNLLADDKPYTIEFTNSAWWKLQEMLALNGVETQIAETVITGLTAVTDLDPATQAYLSYTNYFDGSSTFNTPVLPQDLIIPLRLWERQTGTNQQFLDMYESNDGLPARVKSIRLVEWEWRNNKIYLVGATQENDLRVRYQCYLADFAAVGDPIPIMRAAQALAYFIAEEFALSRGSPQAEVFADKGLKAVLQLVAHTTRKAQRANHRRIPYSRRGGSGFGTGFSY